MTINANEVDAMFAAAAERRRAIDAQLSERPIEEVLGLVDAAGVYGFPQDGRWILGFTFEYWKITPGPVKKRPLEVRRNCSAEEFDPLQDRIPPYAVLRIRARVVEESVIGTSEAELLEVIGPDHSDSELNQAAIDLKTPVVVEDRQFGKLTLDRTVNWYTTNTKWNGAAVVLKLDVGASGAIDGALAAARTLWKDPKRWTERILDYAVEKLLPLKNANWLDEDAGEAELTARQFRSRMKLKSITVRPDGSFDFWHADGGLFSGHWIQVGGDLNAGPTRADIPG